VNIWICPKWYLFQMMCNHCTLHIAHCAMHLRKSWSPSLRTSCGLTVTSCAVSSSRTWVTPWCTRAPGGPATNQHHHTKASWPHQSSPNLYMSPGHQL
jgi:hypothetical protein